MLDTEALVQSDEIYLYAEIIDDARSNYNFFRTVSIRFDVASELKSLKKALYIVLEENGITSITCIYTLDVVKPFLFVQINIFVNNYFMTKSQ